MELTVGQEVRPTATVKRLRPRMTVLQVRRASKPRTSCGGCATTVFEGELYAATKESSSWLCTGCVEPLKDD